ncbi:pyridoxine/pyridoxamine 5'-phosphate oxidase-like [Gigantopelta aegis]|uniref:pyridoxine/pyridoxamine 5'-phosphate oxidase-like n=1 Tax=Gigantopelta aegis TaxID=1735272 RepID=UPI001B88E64A|nr:pyridoxine/pyridoxamine 5'-phosphate oxidase-like [Gigantopelta aegis]
MTGVLLQTFKIHTPLKFTIQLSFHGLGRTMSGDLTGLRIPYKEKHEVFDFDHLASKDPYLQFKCWLDKALSTDGIKEPNAVALATATKNGFPSLRVVLIKEYSQKGGFLFFTNYESRKARELEENPHCSLLFFWPELMQQIRIEGTVSKLSEEESLRYFNTRPKPNQVGAIVSRQSQVVSSRQFLDEKYDALFNHYSAKSAVVPKPDYWGGYSVQPSVFEFWQGQSDRLHDRIVFRKPVKGETINPETTHLGENGWVFERLSP